MRYFLVAILLLRAPVELYAQEVKEPVNTRADYTSYVTAVFNPTMKFIEALRSDKKACGLIQLSLAEIIGNGTTTLIKHLVYSERPCIGCKPDGMPSGHTMNSFIGMSWSWKWGGVTGGATGVERVEANRHTKTQVTIGALIGIGSELLSQLWRCT